jgi:hypothetical protein
VSAEVIGVPHFETGGNVSRLFQNRYSFRLVSFGLKQLAGFFKERRIYGY